LVTFWQTESWNRAYIVYPISYILYHVSYIMYPTPYTLGAVAGAVVTTDATVAVWFRCALNPETYHLNHKP